MGLEDLTGSGKFLDDLVNTNPVGSTDIKATLDDHIRGIKNVLKNSFPNIDAVVNPTPTEFNYLVGVTSAVQTQINAAKIPIGTKMLFLQNFAPAGWTFSSALNDKVLMITNTVGEGGTTGGSWTITGLSVDSTVLDETQIPAHKHEGGGAFRGSSGSSTTSKYGEADSAVTSYVAEHHQSRGDCFTAWSSTVGGGLGHTHGLTTGSAWRPAYVKVIACTKN